MAAARVLEVVARRRWAVVFAAGFAGLAVLHLVGLGEAPPGLYNDEASIGYNAWAVAHHGVDEHGASFPLFFQAFGEWKNPLYIYLLAPFTLVLPLTPYVERLPAALCGLAVVVVVGRMGWRLTGSRAVALLSMLTAGVEPWLVIQSRVGFEVPAMTLTLTLFVWCLVEALRSDHERRWALAAGVALGLSLFAYTSARLLVGMLAVGLVLVDRRRWTRTRGLWPALPPVVVAYALLGAWSLQHAGALTTRFDAISIGADGAGLLTVVGRFVGNYASYFGIPFLFTSGDSNPHHNTGFGGMLLVSLAPVLVAGVVHAVRHASGTLERFALLGTALAPVPAALTALGTPHALRAAPMIPFILLLAAWGWADLTPLLLRHRVWAVALTAAVAVEVGGYLHDLYVDYPGRSAIAFDAGELDAMVAAHDAAHGHLVLLSDSLDAPYIQALFALHPDPSAYASRGLSVLGMEVVSADAMATRAQPGDVMVLAPRDEPPEGASFVAEEAVTVAPPVFGVDRSPMRVRLVEVYRR